MPHNACLLVNPAAGRGRGARVAARIRPAFRRRGMHEMLSTRRAGDERALVFGALDLGYSTLAVVGGDGTLSKVVAAVLESGADLRVLPIPAGTGNDFVKMIPPIPRNPDAIARIALEGHTIATDVGRVDGQYFVNVAGLGFDVAVLESCLRGSWLRGSALYVTQALRQLFAYRGLEADIGDGRGFRRMLIVAVANGRNFGGAFRIAPHASVSDGRLDVVGIADASPLRRLRLFAAAVRGTHLELPDVQHQSVATTTLRFAEPPWLDVDGELRCANSDLVQIECMQRAVKIVVGVPHPQIGTPPARAGVAADA